MDISHLTEEEVNMLFEQLSELKDMKETNLYAYRDWEYYEKQAEIRKYTLHRIRTKDGRQIVCVFGGNRSAKSETAASIVCDLFVNDSSLKIWCATESDLSIKVQQQKLADLIPKHMIRWGDFNASRGWKHSMVTSTTSTKIWFKTYSQERKAFQGESLDLIWLDEECPYDIFQECMARLLDRNGTLLITFTSLMGFTRLVNYLYNPENANVKLYMMTMLENPYIDEEAKKLYMESCDPDEIESRVYGKPKMKQGLVYPEFKDAHIVTPFEYQEKHLANPNRWKIIESIDPHLRTPHHWSRYVYDTKLDILYQVDELKAPVEAMLISDFADMIKAKRMYKPKGKDRAISIKPMYCQIDTSSMTPLPMVGIDGEKPQEDFTIRTEFAKAGISTILCMKDNKVGISAVKERLKFNVNSTGKKNAKLYLFSTCTGTTYEFRRYSWASHVSDRVAERKGSINGVKKVEDHFMDNLKYTCIKLLGGMNPDSNLNTPNDIYKID